MYEIDHSIKLIYFVFFFSWQGVGEYFVKFQVLVYFASVKKEIQYRSNLQFGQMLTIKDDVGWTGPVGLAHDTNKNCNR